MTKKERFANWCIDHHPEIVLVMIFVLGCVAIYLKAGSR